MTNTFQYSCLEKPPIPDREAWQATVYRAAKSWTLPKRPCAYRRLKFFACSSSALVRIEREGGAAAWLAETLAKSAGTRSAFTTGLKASSESFVEPLIAVHQKAYLASLSP